MIHPTTHDQLTDLTPEEIAALADPAPTPARRVIYVADTTWSALLAAPENAGAKGRVGHQTMTPPCTSLLGGKEGA